MPPQTQHRTSTESLLMNTKAILPATTMKRNLLASIAVAITLAALPSARAATDTWTGATGGDWNTAGNWSPAKPGAADTALFNTALGSVTNASANQTVGSISFDTNAGTASGAFTLGTVGGNTLTLGNAGTIQLLSTLSGTGKSISINSPIVLTPASTTTAGAYTFANNATDSTNTLNFGGTISASTTTNTETLTLGGTNTGANTISGVISNGSATTFAITKSGAGKWTLSNANTYNGATTISAGTLDLGGSTATGSLASTVLNLGGGSLAYTRTGNTTQAFTTTNINAGGSSKITAVAGNTLTLGALTRAAGGGAVDIGNTGTITTSTANGAGGILGGWATFNNGTTWAVANGAGSAITGLADGSYTLTSAAGTTAGNYTNQNINVDNSAGALSGVITPYSLRFNSAGANTVTLASGTNTIGAGAILVTSNVGNNLSTITGGNLTGAASADLVINQTNTSNGLTIASAIVNNTATSLSKLGAGTLTLSGTNTYTGATTVGVGVLNIQNNTATGTTAGGVTVVSGAALQIENGITVGAEALALNGTGIASDGALRNISGANVWQGTVTLGSAARINSDAGSLTFNTAANSITGGQNLTLGGAGNGTVGGTITTGGGTLTKDGAGTWTLSGTNTYTGLTTVSAGTLTLNGSSTGTNGGFLVQNASTLNIQQGNYTIANPSSFSVGAASSGAVVNQTGGSVLFTSGNELLIGTSSGSTGTYNLSGGSLTTGLPTTGLPNRGVLLGVNGGSTQSFNLSGTGVLNVVAGSALLIGRDGGAANSNSTFSQTGGTATIALLSMGLCTSSTMTLSLTGGNFTAAAFSNLSNGTSEVSTINIGGTAVVTLPNLPTTRGASSTATINFDGGTLKNSATGTFITGLTNAFIKAGGATFDTSLNSTTISQNLLTDAVSTGGGLTKAGINTLTLNGTNTYTGKTIVQNGTLSFSTGNATATANQQLGANATLDLGVASTSSGTLLYTGAAGTLAKNINALGNGTDTIQNSGTGLLTLSGTLTKNGTVLTLKGGSNGINVTGAIAGSNANSDLIVDGGNTTLSNANTYNGPTSIINGATLNANVTDALPTSNGRTAVYLDQTVAGAATGTGSSILALGSNQSVSSLSGETSSTVNLNARTLTVGSASGTANFAGIISGANGELIKDNASTQILSGNNTYTGSTLVSAGTLLINGTQSSATGTVSVSSTATLGGSGTTGGNVTVASGGFLAPGALSTGTFTTTGSLSLSANATYNFELNSNTLAADKIVANGLTLDSASVFLFADLGSGTIALNHVFVAIDNTSASAISGTFSGLAEGATFTVGSNRFQVSYIGNTGNDFTLTAVPEPATWGLLAFSLTTVMVLRRRRKF